MFRIICVFTMLLMTLNGFSQNGYKVMRAKLPMSTTEKDYYVKQVGAHYVLNGDIIVGNAGQSLMMYQSNYTDGAYIWPKGYVPVKIDRNTHDKTTRFGMSVYDNALKAIEEINANTNVRLVPYTNQRDYIRIMFTTDTGYGGISPVGRRGGEQILYVTNTSDIEVTIHELLHSLGFWHEQSRYDRDNYVVIDTNNVKPEQRYNFQVEPGTPSSAYDYNSIMHYSAYAFAIDRSKPTIQCKNGNVISNCLPRGRSKYFSELDIKGINSTYWFNKDVAKRNYSAELPYDENLPTAKRIKPAVSYTNKEDYMVVNKPLENGIYMIKHMETGQYLDVAGVSKENGATLQQWEKVGWDNQKFAVMSTGNNIFLLKAVHSGKYLNVTGQSTEARAGISQQDYTEQDNFKFYILYNSQKNGYTIMGVQSNMYWMVMSKDKGVPVQQAPNLADVFSFEKMGNIPLVEENEKMKTTVPLKKKSFIKQ